MPKSLEIVLIMFCAVQIEPNISMHQLLPSRWFSRVNSPWRLLTLITLICTAPLLKWDETSGEKRDMTNQHISPSTNHRRQDFAANWSLVSSLFLLVHDRHWRSFNIKNDIRFHVEESLELKWDIKTVSRHSLFKTLHLIPEKKKVKEPRTHILYSREHEMKFSSVICSELTHIFHRFSLTSHAAGPKERKGDV